MIKKQEIATTNEVTIHLDLQFYFIYVIVSNYVMN